LFCSLVWLFALRFWVCLEVGLGFCFTSVHGGMLFFGGCGCECNVRVNISELKIRNADRFSMYLVGQYFAKQPVIRMSYGYQWVYPGFKKSFNHIIEFMRSNHILKASRCWLCPISYLL